MQKKIPNKKINVNNMNRGRSSWWNLLGILNYKFSVIVRLLISLFDGNVNMFHRAMLIAGIGCCLTALITSLLQKLVQVYVFGDTGAPNIKNCSFSEILRSCFIADFFVTIRIIGNKIKQIKLFLLCWKESW